VAKKKKRPSKGPAARAGTDSGRVRKLPPEAKAARDEGPRLIPFGATRQDEHPQLSKYIELADKMLGLDKTKK